MLEGLERVSLEKKWILYQFGRPGTKIASKLLPLIVLQKKEKKNRCPVCLASLSLNTDYRILTFESAWAGDVAQVCVLKAIGVIPSMELERQRQEDPLLHGVF